MMRPNIEVMCIVKFQYATSAMLALPYDHFLVSLLFLDVPITVIVPSLLLTSFLNFLFNLYIHLVRALDEDTNVFSFYILHALGQTASTACFYMGIPPFMIMHH